MRLDCLEVNKQGANGLFSRAEFQFGSCAPGHECRVVFNPVDQIEHLTGRVLQQDRLVYLRHLNAR